MQRKTWIVVGTDFTASADDALDHAVEVATRSGASIALVHAYEDDSSAAPVTELRARLEAAIERSAAARNGVEVDALLRRGTPWEKLCNVATDLGAGSIMIGPRTRLGDGGYVLGAVGARAVAAAKPSVLVIVMTSKEAP